MFMVENLENKIRQKKCYISFHYPKILSQFCVNLSSHLSMPVYAKIKQRQNSSKIKKKILSSCGKLKCHMHSY